MNETNYRIKYRKGDLEVEVQGDKDWVEKKFEELTSKEISIVEAKREEAKGIPETLGEFLEAKGNPKKHRDITAVFAYWLFKVEKMESFHAQDIEVCYDLTRKTKPKQIHVAMNGNIERNVFTEAKEKKDGRKAWVLTRTGEEYIEQMK